MDYTTVIDGVTDNLAIHHNELKDGLQNVEALFNGKFVVTVASNNITVAVKTLSGADPNSANFVGVKINGAMRYITSALNVTVNAGTNTFNSGEAELASFSVGYFVYLGWRSASNAVVVGFARIPYARVYSNFSATATSEKYGAFSTNPGSGDDVENIGYFEATLSGAGSSHLWTVPTFNSENLIYSKTLKSRVLSYAGQASSLAGSISTLGTVSYKYRIDENQIEISHSVNITTNGSGSAFLVIKNPFICATRSVTQGRENQTGKTINGLIPESNNVVYYGFYDGSYPGADGRELVGYGKYYI